MNRIVVVGGKLQGTEALYLSQKGGYRTLLIDKNPEAIGIGLSDQFACVDIIKNPDDFIKIIKTGDVIVPALENQEVLEALDKICKAKGYTYAFDLNSYNISSSKLLSEKMFVEIGMPIPLKYPQCDGPYIAKPSCASGSQGVTYFSDESQLKDFINKTEDIDNWLLQEYLEGPSYSIEIIGKPGNYRTYQITQIHMDEEYDCKMVTSPCEISDDNKKILSQMAIDIAEKLKLKGIMDLEVINHKGKLKLLEIDARIPSQTPSAVFHSTGINLLQELVDIFVYGSFKSEHKSEKRFAAYEQYLIEDGSVAWLGEHIMSEGDRLEVKYNIFGSDVVISDWAKDKKNWRGIFINWGNTEEQLIYKREKILKSLKMGDCND